MIYTTDKIRKELALSFDDVSLIPQYSEISSRAKTDISTTIGVEHPILLLLPIISAPMDTITGANMALALGELGGLGILHRYNSIKDQLDMVTRVLDNFKGNYFQFGVAVGATGDYLERAKQIIDKITTNKFAIPRHQFILCVDVASGNNIVAINAVEKLREEYEDIHIMCGNVAEPDGFLRLIDAGADSVRVGIGSGAFCETQIQTGHGLPTFQSILDIASDLEYRYKSYPEYKPSNAIIADGGIKHAGDIVKSIAAGASAVMVGSLLAGTKEAPYIFDKDGNRVARGQASLEAQKAWRGWGNAAEGVSISIPDRGSIKDIISKVSWNIRSGLSYSGAANFKLLREVAEFIVRTPAGLSEAKPHIKNRI